MENNKDIVICECNSTDHQMIFLYSDDETDGIKYPMCYVHVHLNKRPFWSRLKYGFKYAWWDIARLNNNLSIIKN